METVQKLVERNEQPNRKKKKKGGTPKSNSQNESKWQQAYEKTFIFTSMREGSKVR